MRSFTFTVFYSKDYKIGICCFSAKHAALRRKSKDWLARNQNNVSEWSDMSTRGLLFQWASTIKNPTKHVGLAQSRPHHFQEFTCWSITKWHRYIYLRFTRHALQLHHVTMLNYLHGYKRLPLCGIHWSSLSVIHNVGLHWSSLTVIHNIGLHWSSLNVIHYCEFIFFSFYNSPIEI
jgi:hypothetical protein